jgi:hypothetical protein
MDGFHDHIDDLVYGPFLSPVGGHVFLDWSDWRMAARYGIIFSDLQIIHLILKSTYAKCIKHTTILYGEQI